MKKYLTILLLLFSSFVSIEANPGSDIFSHDYQQNSNKASITFKNSSEYTMVVKIIKPYGGLYTTITLSPYSSRSVSFGATNTYKLKIKAVLHGRPSYHDGGNFSVTCNEREWTEGTMTFKLSSYGSGLGPSISAKEFESDY